MKRNPFYNRQRITDAASFIGRKSEIETLYSAVVTRQCRSLVGERKMGKSSLLNALLGQERAIVSDLPGTTRDPIDTHLLWEGSPLVLVRATRSPAASRLPASRISLVFCMRIR